MPDVQIPPTVVLPIAQLLPWQDNPRRINPAALARLYLSLDEYGLVQPVVFNKRTGELVAGHQRLEVLKQHGATDVPCVIVDWDRNKQAAAALALNSPYGEFDTALLRDVLQELQAASYDIDLTALPPFVIEDTLATDAALERLGRQHAQDSSPLSPADPVAPPAGSVPPSGYVSIATVRTAFLDQARAIDEDDLTCGPDMCLALVQVAQRLGLDVLATELQTHGDN